MSWFTASWIRRRRGPPQDPLLPIANTLNPVSDTGSASSLPLQVPTLGHHNSNDSGVPVPGHSATRPLANPAAPATPLSTTTTPTPLSSIDVSDTSPPHQPLAADTTPTAAPATLWPQRFTERPNINPDFLHETHINLLGSEWQGSEASADLVDSDEEGTGEDETADVSDEDEESGDYAVPDPSIARVFMRSRFFLPVPPAQETTDWQTETVENFSDFFSLDYLQTPDTETEPLAILQERSYDGTRRSRSGAMNWHQLFTALRVPRFKDNLPDGMLPGPPHADQRRLYIRNINPQASAVLMATARTFEFPAVQVLLSGHLGSQSTIGVNIPARGMLMFSLHLNIPYYTLRRDAHCNDERRLKGRLLRQTIEIPGVGDFREAQLSLVTTGVDDGRWTTIALDDNTTRAASDLSSRSDSSLSFYDPIIDFYGFHEQNYTARGYFLWAWMLRLITITKAWESVVSAIEQAIVEKNEKDGSWTASRLSDDMIGDLKASIDTATRWVSLIMPIKLRLSMTVHNWKQFQKCDRDYFIDVITRSQETSRQVYPSIKKSYAELETYLTTLEGLISVLSSTSTQLTSLHDAAIKNRADNESREAAQRHEELTRTMAAKQLDLFKEQLEMSREAARKQDEAARETARREKEMFNRKEAADQQKMEMAREAAKMQEAAFKRQEKRQEEMAREARERASKREQREEAVAEAQQRSLSTSWRVNFTSMSLLPCMLTFTLFSMETDAMPLKPTLPGAAIVLANFGILTILLFNLDHIWRKTCDLCSRWAPPGQVVGHRALQFTWSGLLTGQASKIGLDCKHWLGERYSQFEDRLNRPLRQRPTPDPDVSYDLAVPLPAHVTDVESGTLRCLPP